MSQQIRVTREFNAIGATLLGVGSPYLGAGKVYYVDYNLGDDNHRGTNPNYPLDSIQAGINKCVDGQNDYVFVMASKDADAAAPVNFGTSLTTTLSRVHLIGISNPQAQFGVVMRTTSDTDSCIFMSDGGGQYCEIAGISFGGGATLKAGIEIEQVSGLWIHHNVFGNRYCGDTPDFGIMGDATDNTGLLVEDCVFWGSGDNVGGHLAVHGINLDAAAATRNAIIRRNHFMGLPSIGIYADLVGGMILDNTFRLDDNTAGAAITLKQASKGCWINGNSANHGGTNSMAAIPYVDDAADGDDANTWGMNWTAGVVDFPAS